jgi:uncharacterized tellurite resistance protein B-like protein
MPIIALVLSGLAFWLLYWFFRLDGFSKVQAVFSRRSQEARLVIARERERLAPLTAVDDPRDAATILMLLLVRSSGDPTREQIAAIETTVRAVFGFDRELTEHMTQARFIASRADSFEQAAGQFSNLLNKRLNVTEKHQLVAMLEEVAEPTEAQTEAILMLKRRLALAPQR